VSRCGFLILLLSKYLNKKMEKEGQKGEKGGGGKKGKKGEQDKKAQGKVPH
jgi:hypothetical protein